MRSILTEFRQPLGFFVSVTVVGNYCCPARCQPMETAYLAIIIVFSAWFFCFLCIRSSEWHTMFPPVSLVAVLYNGPCHFAGAVSQSVTPDALHNLDSLSRVL